MRMRRLYFMATQKIAITIPPPFLKRLDEWAKKMGRSRSRFIVEEMDKRLRKLEDEEITQIYDEAFSDQETVDQDRQLTEEMIDISAIHQEDDKW
jgi:metal-responsive CopG/Arc/MetJ family transcriptional regulator